MTDEIIQIDSGTRIATPNENWAIRRYGLYNDGSGLFSLPSPGLSAARRLKWEIGTWANPPYTVDPYNILNYASDTQSVKLFATGIYTFRLRLLWEYVYMPYDPDYLLYNNEQWWNTNELTWCSVSTNEGSGSQGSNLVFTADTATWQTSTQFAGHNSYEDMQLSIDFEWFQLFYMQQPMRPFQSYQNDPATQGEMGVLELYVEQYQMDSVPRNLVCNGTNGAKMGTFLDVAYWGSFQYDPLKS